MAILSAARRRWKSILIGAAIFLAGLALVAPILLDRLTRVRTPAVKLPNPNGYNDFIRAGVSVVGQAPRQGRVWDADATELHAFVDANPEALRLIRLALSRDSMVPIQYSDGFLGSHLGDMTALRDGARVLSSAGFLAISEDRFDDAVTRFVNLIRLGQGVSAAAFSSTNRSGCRRNVLASLDLRIRSKLSAKACRDLIKRLAELDAHREPIDDVIRRDRLLGRASADWYTRTLMTVHPKPFEDFLRPAYDITRRLYRIVLSRHRLLMIDLALRAYRFDHGGKTWPKTLDALVPEYLERLPSDPFRPGGGFVYKVVGDEFLLYGLGPDGDDDGGKALPEFSPTAKNRDDGDLRVDPS